MSLYNNTVSNFYRFLFTDLADKRTNHWFLITDPMTPLSVLIAYLFFVLKWGPEYMKHRKPYNINNLLVIYNFLQVLLSIWMFGALLYDSWDYNWKCQSVDFSNSPRALRMARHFYTYFLAKMTELLDTMFFVLRKKNSQITFLHVYHHTCMPMISWGGTKYFPGGHGAFIGTINSFIHIIMYTYYMMSAMGPKYHKYLWWKKYITTLQLIQFGLTFLHNSQLFFYDCGYPRWVAFITVPNSVIFYFLFTDFYRKAYPKSTKIAQISRSNGVSVCSNGIAKTNGFKVDKKD